MISDVRVPPTLPTHHRLRPENTRQQIVSEWVNEWRESHLELKPQIPPQTGTGQKNEKTTVTVERMKQIKRFEKNRSYFILMSSGSFWRFFYPGLAAATRIGWKLEPADRALKSNQLCAVDWIHTEMREDQISEIKWKGRDLWGTEKSVKLETDRFGRNW